MWCIWCFLVCVCEHCLVCACVRLMLVILHLITFEISNLMLIQQVLLPSAEVPHQFRLGSSFLLPGDIIPAAVLWFWERAVRLGLL